MINLCDCLLSTSTNQDKFGKTAIILQLKQRFLLHPFKCLIHLVQFKYSSVEMPHWTRCLFMPAYRAHEAGALVHIAVAHQYVLLLMPAVGGSVVQVVGAPAFSWILLFLLQRHGFSAVLHLVQSMIIYSMECETKSHKGNLISCTLLTAVIIGPGSSLTGSHATGFWPKRPFRFIFFVMRNYTSKAIFIICYSKFVLLVIWLKRNRWIIWWCSKFQRDFDLRPSNDHSRNLSLLLVCSVLHSRWLPRSPSGRWVGAPPDPPQQVRCTTWTLPRTSTSTSISPRSSA